MVREHLSSRIIYENYEEVIYIEGIFTLRKQKDTTKQSYRKGHGMASEYKLELRGVSKSFPGVKALDNVQLAVRPGTVHALMGENGRSEERRVGKECSEPCRSRWSPYH